MDQNPTSALTVAHLSSLNFLWYFLGLDFHIFLSFLYWNASSKKVFKGHVGLIFSVLDISRGLYFLLLAWLTIFSYDFVVILHPVLLFKKASYILRRPHEMTANMAGHRFILLPQSGIPLKSHLGFWAPGGIRWGICWYWISAFFLLESCSSSCLTGVLFLFLFVRVLPSKLPVCKSASISLFLGHLI